MKMCSLLLAAFAAASVSAVAAGIGSDSRLHRLPEIVTYMESAYGGEVTAVQLDTSGDKRPHYHVDLRYAQGGVAKIDVDAVSREIFAHDTGDLPAGSATLPEVTLLIAKHVPGSLTFIELDTADGAPPHYDVDVRLGGRKIARLKVDATTRAIGWRQPAVVDE